MMKICLKIKIGIFLIMCINIPPIYAQQVVECRMALQKTFKILQNAEALMKSGFYMDYKAQMCLGETHDYKCGEDSAILIMKGRKSVLQSGTKTIYRDENAQVVIMTDRKKIMITTVRQVDNANIPVFNFSHIQDSILLTSTYSDCKLEVIGKDSCYSATLTISPSLKKQTGVEKACYVVNKTRGTMKKIELQYIEGKQFSKSIFFINNVKYSYDQEPFTGPALQLVYDTESRVLDAYKDFQIIDLRKKVQK